jgi:hypothetical protein
MKNKTENIIQARIKFITTQARIMIACCQAGLFPRL